MQSIFAGQRIVWLAALLLTMSGVTRGAGPAKFMMRARVDGEMVEGRPLWWNNHQMLLMARDGSIVEFNPKQAKESQRTSPRFFGYEMRDMKPSLYREFGKGWDITTTQHYMVVHPRGVGEDWADRFEKLYRSFIHYFRVRGFQPREPQYPLVAIVFPRERDYYRYASTQGSKLQPNTLGHYDPRSNRIMLYDLTTAGGTSQDNADTIVHEATHQMAFNTSIHTRFTSAPQWCVEGLATLFEARGVWDSRSYQTQRDRFNEGRLRDFKHFMKSRESGYLQELIASDQPFRRDSAQAYCESWAVTFFLCETRSRNFFKYLELSADREMFTDYPATDRVRDFQSVFGKDIRWLESKMVKYIEAL